MQKEKKEDHFRKSASKVLIHPLQAEASKLWRATLLISWSSAVVHQINFCDALVVQSFLRLVIKKGPKEEGDLESDSSMGHATNTQRIRKYFFYFLSPFHSVSLGGSLSRPVHLPARKPVPLPLGAGSSRRSEASGDGQRRRELEDLFWRTVARIDRRVCHALRHRAHLPGHDSFPLSVYQVPVPGSASRYEHSAGQYQCLLRPHHRLDGRLRFRPIRRL